MAVFLLVPVGKKSKNYLKRVLNNNFFPSFDTKIIIFFLTIKAASHFQIKKKIHSFFKKFFQRSMAALILSKKYDLYTNRWGKLLFKALFIQFSSFCLWGLISKKQPFLLISREAYT